MKCPRLNERMVNNRQIILLLIDEHIGPMHICIENNSQIH